jgi:hypothetical protein
MWENPQSTIIDLLVSERVEIVLALAICHFADHLPKTKQKKSSSAV